MKHWDVRRSISGDWHIYHHHPVPPGGPWVGIHSITLCCYSCQESAPDEILVALKIMRMGEKEPSFPGRYHR
jgi:hypothetical protein